MKERIVIKEKTFKDFLLKHKDNHEICAFSPAVIMSRCKVEKVPETFEDLKELCKDLEDKKILTTSTGIIVEDDCIEFHGLQFLKSGIISHETEIDKGLAIRLNRTPEQMWTIIKNLIGEE